MLMQSNYFNVVLACDFQGLFQIIGADAELAVVPRSDHVLVLACATVVVRVNPDENILASKLGPEIFESIHSPNIDADIIGQSIVNLLLADEIFSVKNLAGLIAAIQGSVDLARRNNIHVCDAFTFVLDDFEDFGVTVGLHRIANVNVARCPLQLVNVAQY